MLDVVETSTARLLTAVDEASDAALESPSLLPGWSRLTILAHLRYVGEATQRMTEAALRGDPAAMYPGGRDAVRPPTLEPRPGESTREVVGSLRQTCAALHERWRALVPEEWESSFYEPELGSLTIRGLMLMRLTEIEVHSEDLDLGLGPWSTEFIDAVLPWRIESLARLRQRGDADLRVNGSWFITDGREQWRVTAHGTDVRIVEGTGDDRWEADSIVEGDREALVRMLLGRLPVAQLELSGDIDLGLALKRAFPGP